MERAIYELNANDLDERFLNSVKTFFKDRRVKIRLAAEPDETDFLLSFPANRRKLLAAIENVKQGNLIDISLDDVLSQCDE